MARLQSVIGGLRTSCTWCGPAVSAVVLVTLAAPSEAAWHRLDSPNFVVVGDASPRQLRSVAARFEAFREILGRVAGGDVAMAPVPTIVLVFRSDRVFSPFTPRYQGRAVDIDGLFVPARDVNHIAFVNQGADQAPRIMYHEYAHLVIQNSSGRVPVWLNEGLAEVYSTFELSRDGREALIGRTIDEHLALLNTTPLLKLTDLLQVDHDSPLYNEGDRRSVFYAQSWALVHMLIFGEPSRAPQLRAFLQAFSRGLSAEEAWAQAFGAERIASELARYVSRGLYRAAKHKSPDRTSRFDATAKPLPPADVQAFLARFLLAQGRHDEAAEQLAAAMKADDRSVHAAVVRGQREIAAGEHAAGLERLLAVKEPADWLGAYYAAVALADAAEATHDRRSEVIAAATRFFDAAARERSFPNALIRRAAMEIAPGHVPPAATLVAVQAARSAAPGRDDYAFVHAQLLALSGDFRGARRILGPLMAAAPEQRVRDAARSAMAWVVGLERHQTARAAPPGAADAVPSAAGAASPAPDPRGVLPVFRELQPGEDRLEGVLQRIDCAGGGSAVFVLGGSGETVRLPASRMADVDFITYREDVTGTVSCGPLKEPMKVYVTWRKQSKPDAMREVVAVEFLPKQYN